MYWFIPELFDLFKAALWPLVALIIFYQLKNPISDTLKSIKFFNYKELSVVFESKLEQIEKRADLLSIKSNSKKTSNSVVSSLKDPRSIIIESWLSLEASISLLFDKTRNERPDSLFEKLLYSDVLKKIKFLHKEGVISDEDIFLINQIRVLRNLVSHEADISIINKEQALRYADLANKLNLLLETKIYTK